MIPSEVRNDIVMSWTAARARWFPLLALVALLMSCTPGTDDTAELPPGVVEGSPTIGVAPSPTATAVPAECPNEDAIAADPARQIGPSSVADVDGDGINDQVRLARDPAGPDGCATFVVAELRNVSVISAPVWQVGAEGGLPQPRIHGFVDIDGRGGDEILVNEAAGASTQFVGAFMVVADDLERITARGQIAQGGPFADLFPFGGSVGHIDAVDCTDDGIVVSAATPSGETVRGGSVAYDVERRFFTFDGASLDEQEVDVQTVPIEDLDRFPEYEASPFGTCSR